MSLSSRIKFFLNPKSIRFRLTLIFLGFLAAVLIGFSVVIYKGFVADQQNEFDAALYNYATDIARNVEITVFGNFNVDDEVLWDKGKIFPFFVGQAVFQVVDRKGNILAKSRSLGKNYFPVTGEDIEKVSRFQVGFRTANFKHPESREKNPISYRVIGYPLDVGRGSEIILQVAAPLVLIEQQTRKLLNFLFLTVPLALVVVALGGFYLSTRVLSPVAAIIEKAGLIGATKLSERLPVPETEDELHHLSVTLNSLLDRLQRAFESQERFVADASHQLKTPLAILRGELDVLRSRPRTQEEYVDFIESSRQELGYLSRIVDDLLMLARMDAGAESFALEDVRVDEVAVEAIARLEKFADARQIKIRLNLSGSNFETKSDADLLRTMIQSLVENAIKFANASSVIEVDLNEKDDRIVFKVCNRGPVIPPEHLPKIFQRFYQVDNAGGGRSGLGIGLAIVKRITELHQGGISVASTTNEGTTFTAEIKKF